MEAIEASAEVPRSSSELRAAADGPAGQLAAMVGSDRRLLELGGDVIALMREAGRAHPELLAAYREGRAQADRIRREVFSRWPPEALREGIDAGAAADAFAALCNIDVYRVLIEGRGWAPDRVER